MPKLVGMVLEVCLVYPNPAAKCSGAPNLVPKPEPAEWRFAADLRPVNMYTPTLHFLMPLIEAELNKGSGVKVFRKFDMKHGYRRLLLYEDSQECQSLVLSADKFTFTHVLLGYLNSNAHLHTSFMSEMPHDLREKLLSWVDGLAIAIRDIDDLLNYITKLLGFCVEVSFYQYPVKVCRFKSSTTWCGQSILTER